MKKILFGIIIAFLMFWIISPILLNLFELEFNDKKVELSFENIRFWGLLICILLTLFLTIKQADKLGEFNLKVALVVGATILVFFIMAASVLGNICEWTTREILFTNKENEKVKIVRRDYGCGAVDSGPPIVKDFEIKEVTKFFTELTINWAALLSAKYR